MAGGELSRYATELRALAEGRTAPEDWLAWWERHGQDVKTLCSPGAFLRLKPKFGTDCGGVRAALISQDGACRVLDDLGVTYDRSDRYLLAWQRAVDDPSEEQGTEPARKAEDLAPVVDRLAAHFPRFAAFLRADPGEIEGCRPGLDDAALDRLEESLGVRLPSSYRAFLRCARELVVGDTLQLTAAHPFVHDSESVTLPTQGLLCVADYWREADGDQVLFDLRGDAGDDPPVLYYAHARRRVRVIADGFAAWVEALPGALAD